MTSFEFRELKDVKFLLLEFGCNLLLLLQEVLKSLPLFADGCRQLFPLMSNVLDELRFRSEATFQQPIMFRVERTVRAENAAHLFI